jgi:hypothetical protein
MLSHEAHTSQCSVVRCEKRRESDAWTSPMPSGRFSNRSSVTGGGKMGEAGRGGIRVRCGRTCCRSYARVLPGTICLPAIRAISPVIDASKSCSAPAALTRTAETGRRLARLREARSERIIHRRQFQFGEKGGAGVGPTKPGKGGKIMAIADCHGLPLAVQVVSASANEATPVEPKLQRRFLRETPQRLIGDKA